MNRNLTIVLVIVFVALLIYVLVVQVPKDQAQANITPSPMVSNYVWSIQAEQIAGVRVLDKAQNLSVAFAKGADGVWTITEPENRPADSAQITNELYKFTGLYVRSELTTTTDLTPYGVLSPTYTIEVNLTDGSALKADVGNLNPTSSSYYVLRQGETVVLLVNKSSIDGIVGLIAAPPYIVPTPTVGFATPIPVLP